MNEEQFEQLISAIEQSNKTHLWEYVINALIAAIAALVVTYSVESYRDYSKSKVTYHNLRQIQSSIEKANKLILDEIEEIKLDIKLYKDTKRIGKINLYYRMLIDQLKMARTFLVDYEKYNSFFVYTLDKLISDTEAQNKDIVQFVKSNSIEDYNYSFSPSDNYDLILEQYSIFKSDFKYFRIILRQIKMFFSK
ncbi:hypothetical protein [Aerococcus viridans]|uniref:Uncharacterized protein n=1 Tax=Aerococcus viridans TaxID=1377 RepID=A0A2J9PKF3_9LACT|nr:hypothetical protein [Aerococcus viridans]PNL90829.1 hypothetical protein A6J77_000525 [Aerococcus viridans]